MKAAVCKKTVGIHSPAVGYRVDGVCAEKPGKYVSDISNFLKKKKASLQGRKKLKSSTYF